MGLIIHTVENTEIPTGRGSLTNGFYVSETGMNLKYGRVIKPSYAIDFRIPSEQTSTYIYDAVSARQTQRVGSYISYTDEGAVFNDTNRTINPSSSSFSYFNISSTGLTIGVDYSFEMYFKMSGATSTNQGNNMRLFQFGDGSGVNGIICNREQYSGNCAFMFANGAWSTKQKITGFDVLKEDKWTHLVGTVYSSGPGYNKMSLYFDGVKVAYKATSDIPALPTVTRNNHYLGRSGWTGDPGFSGTMAYFRTWPYALRQNEIETLYNRRDIKFGLYKNAESERINRLIRNTNGVVNGLRIMTSPNDIGSSWTGIGSSTPIHLSQVEVWVNDTNIALASNGGSAIASSDKDTPGSGVPRPASNLIDGNFGTIHHTADYTHPSFAVTNGFLVSPSNCTKASFSANTLSALAKIMEALALRPALINTVSLFLRVPLISN